MNKQEFLLRLRKGLSGLPQPDIEERLAFYDEMIDDRLEEGLSEEEAVSAIGSVDEIISQIVTDIPLTKLVKEKIIPRKKLKVWEITLLILGSPIWFSLLLAALAVILSLYIVLWSVIVCLWTVLVALAACAVAGIAACIISAIKISNISTVALLGVGTACTGLAIFMFFGCIQSTKYGLKLTKMIATRIKNCFMGSVK